MQFQIFKSRKPEGPSVLNLIQSKAIEKHKVPSLGHHIVYPCLAYPSYELERTISHLNLTVYKHWNGEKILRKFTNKCFK